METLNRLPWAAQNSVFQRLAEIAEVSAMTKEERIQYDGALKRYRDMLNTLRGAELKGEAKGRMETAKNLKAMGLGMDDIVKATGLTAEEVAAL